MTLAARGIVAWECRSCNGWATGMEMAWLVELYKNLHALGNEILVCPGLSTTQVGGTAKAPAPMV